MTGKSLYAGINRRAIRAAIEEGAIPERIAGEMQAFGDLGSSWSDCRWPSV